MLTYLRVEGIRAKGTCKMSGNKPFNVATADPKETEMESNLAAVSTNIKLKPTKRSSKETQGSIEATQKLAAMTDQEDNLNKQRGIKRKTYDRYAIRSSRWQQ